VCEVLKRKINRKPIDPVWRGKKRQVVYLAVGSDPYTRYYIIIIISIAPRPNAVCGARVQQAKRPVDVMEIENNHLNDRHSANALATAAVVL